MTSTFVLPEHVRLDLRRVATRSSLAMQDLVTCRSVDLLTEKMLDRMMADLCCTLYGRSLSSTRESTELGLATVIDAAKEVLLNWLAWCAFRVGLHRLHYKVRRFKERVVRWKPVTITEQWHVCPHVSGGKRERCMEFVQWQHHFEGSTAEYAAAIELAKAVENWAAHGDPYEPTAQLTLRKAWWDYECERRRGRQAVRSL